MWLNDTIRILETEGKDPNDAYAIMMDTDTILNARPLQQVWAKFDCARKGKPILVGGETGCWFGAQCKEKHVSRYYRPLGPTLNTFINSGYIMGSLPALQKMFSFISNNYAYFRRIIYWIHWFCDQSAYTFFYGHNRELIQIDEYQQVFGTLSVFVEGANTKHSANTCRSHMTSEVVFNQCGEVLYPLEFFSINPDTCICYLKTNINMSSLASPSSRSSFLTNRQNILLPYFKQMSPDAPIVYHGNAKGKGLIQHIKPLVKKCLLRKYKIKQFI